MKKNRTYMKEIIKAIALNDNDFNELLISILNPIEIRIFFLRFDTDGNISMTMKEIGKKFNTSKQSINIYLNKIYEKLEKEATKKDPSFKSKFMFTKSKKEQLIETINELYRLPKQHITSSKQSSPERLFLDGTNQRCYYDLLKSKCNLIKKKLEDNQIISDEERTILNDYEEIQRVIEKHQKVTRVSDKAQELIDFIKDQCRLPKQNIDNNAEATLENGTNMRNYYNSLKNEIITIKEKQEREEELSLLEKQKLYDYEHIRKELNKHSKLPEYRNPYCSTKKEEFIATIHRNHRIPKRASSNYGIHEEFFSNGDIQILYYMNLRTKVNQLKKKISSGEELTKEEQECINTLQEIDNVLSFYPRKFNILRREVINLCNILGIKFEDNISLQYKSLYEIFVKIKFMIENNIPLTNNGKINTIIYMSDINMQEKYNVSINELVRKYINGNTSYSDEIESIKKFYKK